ncbi:MAG: copper homeostasis protein CutC [Bacteroidota bacterium]
MPSTSSKYLLEIACFNVASCIIAQQAGADRIEFCADYEAGGITPTPDHILEVRKSVSIPLHVIIRPRSGDFVYSSEDITRMKQSILFCNEHRVDGVVFGVLNPDKTINTEVNKKLIDLAKPMSVTFHRAIDQCDNIEKALNALVKLNFDKVLTSGGKVNALDGMETLQSFQKKFGDKIIIMPGGGIRRLNLEQILEITRCVEFHSAAIINHTISAEEIKHLKNILQTA